MSLSDTWGQISEAMSRPQRGLSGQRRICPHRVPPVCRLGCPWGTRHPIEYRTFLQGSLTPITRGGGRSSQLSVETKETEWEGAPAEGPDPSTAHALATKTQERGPWRPWDTSLHQCLPQEQSGWGPRGHGPGHPLTRLDGLEDALLRQSLAL